MTQLITTEDFDLELAGALKSLLLSTEALNRATPGALNGHPLARMLHADDVAARNQAREVLEKFGTARNSNEFYV